MNKVPVFIACTLMAASSHALAADSEARQTVVISAPEYPEKAIRERLEGKVVVCFSIDAQGRVRRPYVLSSTARIFRKPALRSLRASSFAPARDAAQKPQKRCRSFDFRLNPITVEEPRIPRIDKPRLETRSSIDG